MKKYLPFLAVLLAMNISAQRYEFSVSNAPYSPLTNPTVLELPEFWDDPDDAIIPINIPVSIFGSDFYQFGVFDGYFDFTLITPPEAFGYVSMGGYDLAYKPGCLVQYQTEGTAPNRIFKIEFVNVGFYAFEDSDDFFNGQIWLHENGCVSAHIGSYNNTNSQEMNAGLFLISDLDSVALVSNNITTIEYNEITLSELENSGEDVLAAGLPEANTVFQFCPRISSVGIIEPEVSISIFPNPAIDQIVIRAEEKQITQVEIMGLDGKLKWREALERSNENKINLASLSAGAYLLNITLEDGTVARKKFVKQ